MSRKLKRIAMWSGPRNISTALMRSWENRPDTCVVDEPFYACYLASTQIRHPMQDEVLASQSSDWDEVISKALSASEPGHLRIQYQKHMTQHMVGKIDKPWFASLSHAFLIRHPADVVVSYRAKRNEVTAADIGFEQQSRLFDLVCDLSEQPPPVVDSKDILLNPELTLRKLCGALEVPFFEQMLHWPAGSRASDGVWASHWYQNVERSIGFAEYRHKTRTLTDAEQRVVDDCLPFYLALKNYCL